MKFLPAAVALVAGVASATPAPRAFHPSQYKKSFATCKAVDRGGDAPVDVNLKLAYVDINPTAQKTIVMVHGWPSLWTTYRHQIDTLGKDYRLIIVELRGFGDSEHPDDLISSNSMLDVCGNSITEGGPDVCQLVLIRQSRLSATSHASWTMPMFRQVSAWAMILVRRSAGALVVPALTDSLVFSTKLFL